MRLEAKPAERDQLAAFLEPAHALAQAETGTMSGFATVPDIQPAEIIAVT